MFHVIAVVIVNVDCSHFGFNPTRKAPLDFSGGGGGGGGGGEEERAFGTLHERGGPRSSGGGGHPRASAMRCYAAPCYAMLWCAICGAGLAPSAAERVPFPARIRATPPRSVPFSSTPRDSTPPRSSSVLRAPCLSGARGAANVRISGRSGARGATTGITCVPRTCFAQSL